MEGGNWVGEGMERGNGSGMGRNRKGGNYLDNGMYG